MPPALVRAQSTFRMPLTGRDYFQPCRRSTRMRPCRSTEYRPLAKSGDVRAFVTTNFDRLAGRGLVGGVLAGWLGEPALE
jgi:hypothetical protein